MYMGFVDNVTCHIPNMIHPNVPTLEKPPKEDEAIPKLLRRLFS